MYKKAQIIKNQLGYIIIATDFLLVTLASIFAIWFKFSNLENIDKYIWATIVSALILVGIFRLNNLYQNLRGKNLYHLHLTIFKSWVTWVLTLCFFMFFTKLGEDLSRIWFFIFVTSAFILLSLEHLILQKTLNIMRAKGLNQKPILFIGSKEEHTQINNQLQENNWSGFNITKFIETKKDVNINTKQILNDIKNNKIHEVWISFSLTPQSYITEALNSLKASCINIRLIPIFDHINLLNHSFSEIADMPVINIRTSPLYGINQAIKYLEDKILSSVILILTSPILLLIAIGVKLSSKGPVFYVQQRLSWNGKKINMLKFRSMPLNTENKTGAVWAKSDENRATKFGSFLRKTSLDELPQFINVLKGDMSIVGPRPERPVFVKEFKEQIPGYMQKHLVKAGITGWAQINGWRGSTDLKKRIEYDLYYIDNWSLSLDLKIILLTIFKGMINKNAY